MFKMGEIKKANDANLFHRWLVTQHKNDMHGKWNNGALQGCFSKIVVEEICNACVSV